LIKNQYLSHRDVEIATNALGFRAPDLPEEKGREYRILVLGDSITLGDYVAEDETYPSRVENYLRPNQGSLRVINAGIGSSDIKNEFETLLETGLKAKPDLVLIGLYLNDGELSANLFIPPPPGILKHSYFASWLNRESRLLLYRWKHREDLGGKNSAWLKAFVGGRDLKGKDWVTDRDGLDSLIALNYRDWGAAWDPRTWQIIESYLVKIKQLQDQYHFQLAVALFPVRYQVEATYLNNVPQNYFEGLMAKLNIPHLDLLPLLRQAYAANTGQALYYDKCHLTPVGNDLVGKSIAKFLDHPPSLVAKTHVP